MGIISMKPAAVRYAVVLLSLLLGGCGASGLLVDRDQAYKFYDQGDYATACQQFEQLVSEIPKDDELWFRMANACARAEYPQKAIDAYQEALVRNPSLTKAWYNMGIVQMQTALNSFTEMQRYTPVTDPIRQKGEEMQEGLLQLLGDTSRDGREAK